MSPHPIVVEAESRVRELETRLAASHTEAEAALAELGATIAQGTDASDEGDALRRRIARARQAAEELEAAMPVARAAAAQAREQAAQFEVAAPEAARLGSEYAKLAARIDDALAELGAAFDELERLRPALTSALRNAGQGPKADVLSRRATATLHRAIWHANPSLARTLGLGSVAPHVVSHDEPFATAAATVLGASATDADER